jgi:hypothetical protein
MFSFGNLTVIEAGYLVFELIFVYKMLVNNLVYTAAYYDINFIYLWMI